MTGQRQRLKRGLTAGLIALAGLTNAVLIVQMPSVLPLTSPEPVAAALAPAADTVDLVGGRCNPVATTHPNGTPIETVAEGIDPQRGNDTIWRYEVESNIFVGWRRDAPSFANDLASVNFLDPLTICVSDDATFTRPNVQQQS